jgi:hypothetical protein
MPSGGILVAGRLTAHTCVLVLITVPHSRKSSVLSPATPHPGKSLGPQFTQGENGATGKGRKLHDFAGQSEKRGEELRAVR